MWYYVKEVSALMKPKNSGSGRRIVCLVLVAVMLLGLISSALIIMVNAASSSEIKKELNGLRSQQAELKKEREALQAKIKENQSKTQTLVEKKSDIDQQISMTQASIDNLNEQVQQYSLLIANKQADLEASQAEEQRLNTQYKTRIRSMEETGSISYWAILFGANSFYTTAANRMSRSVFQGAVTAGDVVALLAQNGEGA